MIISRVFLGAWSSAEGRLGACFAQNLSFNYLPPGTASNTCDQCVQSSGVYSGWAVGWLGCSMVTWVPFPLSAVKLVGRAKASTEDQSFPRLRMFHVQTTTGNHGVWIHSQSFPTAKTNSGPSERGDVLDSPLADGLQAQLPWLTTRQCWFNIL